MGTSTKTTSLRKTVSEVYLICKTEGSNNNHRFDNDVDGRNAVKTPFCAVMNSVLDVSNNQP